MYAACFELEGRSIALAALRAPSGALVLLPKPWQSMLLAGRETGFALRLTHREGRCEALVLVRGGSAAEVNDLTARMLAAIPTAEGARAAADAAEFDAWAADFPACQAWLNHGGYSVGGRPVAADFRIYPLVEPLSALPEVKSAEFVYQCNFEPLMADRERDRAAKKLIAALKVERSLPRGVADQQESIAARLLSAGFVCDEFLAATDGDAMQAIQSAAGRHFAETMGRLGFAHSPLETGSFDDLLLTGLGSATLSGEPELIAKAAAVFSIEDARRMLDLHLPPPLAAGPAPEASGRGPSVFISYSSADFAMASATCQYLEANGISCWIAPRNILPGEPYPDAIMRGLSAARAMVVVLSSASNVSIHVHREIEAALNQRAIIIPMRVEPIEPTGGMRYLIGTCQRLDAFEEFEKAISLLLVRLRAELSHA